MAFTHKVKEGDTLNKIAQQYGFSNYKEAGISSVPSGNFDLIRPGEEINLENYNPNEIKPIKKGSDVISSEDHEMKYAEDTDRLAKIDESMARFTEKPEAEGAKTETESKVDLPPEFEETTEEEKAKGTTSWDKYLKTTVFGAKEAEREAESDREDRRNLYKTSLAAIDATTAATIQSIQATYDRQLAEQKRINDRNIARVKAYGLSSGGQYTPGAFSGAITNEEESANRKIEELESKRNALIAQAKAARNEGESKLLTEKLDKLDEIDKDLQDTLLDIDNKVKENFKIWKDYNKELEKEHQNKVDEDRKILTAMLEDEDMIDLYEEDPEAFFERIKLDKDFTLSFADVFDIGNTAVSERNKKETEAKEKEAEAEREKTIFEVDIAYKKAQTNKLYNEILKGEEEEGEEEFSKTELKKLEQAGLADVDRQIQLDYLYGNDIQKEEALEKAKKEGEEETIIVISPDGVEGTIPKSQLEEALKEGYKKKE